MGDCANYDGLQLLLSSHHTLASFCSQPACLDSCPVLASKLHFHGNFFAWPVLAGRYVRLLDCASLAFGTYACLCHGLLGCSGAAGRGGNIMLLCCPLRCLADGDPKTWGRRATAAG